MELITKFNNKDYIMNYTISKTHYTYNITLKLFDNTLRILMGELTAYYPHEDYDILNDSYYSDDNGHTFNEFIFIINLTNGSDIEKFLIERIKECNIMNYKIEYLNKK